LKCIIRPQTKPLITPDGHQKTTSIEVRNYHPNREHSNFVTILIEEAETGEIIDIFPCESYVAVAGIDEEVCFDDGAGDREDHFGSLSFLIDERGAFGTGATARGLHAVFRGFGAKTPTVRCFCNGEGSALISDITAVDIVPTDMGEFSMCW
jgi:hypothetical protein